MPGPEQETHCTEHQKTILAVNDLKNETGQLRKEADEVWKRIQSFLTVGSFRWTVSGLVFIVCLAVGANWKQQSSMDTKLDTITNKLSFIEGRASSGKNRTPGMVKQISL
jgi:hypothetical protein